MIRRALSLFLGVTLAVATATAGTADPPADYIAILPGYVFPDRSLGTEGQGFTMSVLYGRPLSSHLIMEFNVAGSIFETGTRAGTDYYQRSTSASLVYAFANSPDAALTPFLVGGIGAAYDDLFPNSRDGFSFLANAGAGVVTRPLLGDRLRLRFEARYVFDSKEGGHSEPQVSLGLQIPLGRPARVEYRAVKEVEVREVVREVPRPWVDSDGDGVDDQHDLCPGTPPGMRVDAHGCAIADQTVELHGVTFEFNKARLTPNAETVLDVVAKAFLGQPGLKVEIGGYTDSIGSVAANLLLSQRRAESVRNYLIHRGARPEQLTARGYGKSRLLIDPETNDQDRERNRRVELRVVGVQ
jgi:OOP family OmpA-OmpF porin